MVSISVFTVFAAGVGDPMVYDKFELVCFTVPLLSGVGMCSFRYPAKAVPMYLLVTLIMAFLAEGFYASQIFILAQSYWVPALAIFSGYQGQN